MANDDGEELAEVEEDSTCVNNSQTIEPCTMNAPGAIPLPCISDSDSDGFLDYRDFCPESIAGEDIGNSGCSIEDLRPPECKGMKLTNLLTGTDGDDELIGTNQGDLIAGFGGKDVINGREGHDCILGGDGDDKIDGGLWEDVILGEAGNDTIIGDRGSDKLYGGDGDDVLSGGENGDTLVGGAGTDSLSGGPGNDTCEAEDEDGHNTGCEPSWPDE